MVINIISGVPVDFPNEPYPTQFFMMNRIINTLIKGHNCLLELPTGSGKTMGLLCSTLAWFKNGALAVDPSTGNQTQIITKIFYGTRTHKQIQQVVRELNKTAYRNVKMDILAGRNQTCLNEEVKRKPDINQGCRDACRKSDETMQCIYRKKGSIKAMENRPLISGTWDLTAKKEELKRINCCPYYQMKYWVSPADIIFCPYNYILNPFIRRALKIDLKRAVLILDEAHNIEEICRESTSLVITAPEIELCLIQLRLIDKENAGSPFIPQLIKMLVSLQAVIKILGEKTFQDGDNVLERCWDSRDFIALLGMNNMARGDIKGYQDSLIALNEFLRTCNQQVKVRDIEDCHLAPCGDAHSSCHGDDINAGDGHSSCHGDDINAGDGHSSCHGDDIIASDGHSSCHGDRDQVEIRNEATPSQKTKQSSETLQHFFVSMESINMMETFLMICQLIHDEERNCHDDFNVIITEDPRKRAHNSTAMSSPAGAAERQLILNIWCMNPGIAFKEISANCHSIILTSGTLNPTASFQLELQCQFQTIFEAPHVVSTDRTFLASISRGPTNKQIQAVFSNIEKFEFKDELGRMILECCKVVPNGVLCFLSSFTYMIGLLNRWQDTGIMNEIKKHKFVSVEPKSSVEMENCMAQFYKKIKTGALLFAVYRGKASEGIDFADDAARLVITVGIPYPSIADPKIVLKRSYNDKKNQERRGEQEQNLSGHQWYNVQAFRALNQAIGRCIRHRCDWGAMLMVDSRFDGCNPSYGDGLCKWMKRRKAHYDIWNEFIWDLVKFVERLSPVEKEGGILG